MKTTTTTAPWGLDAAGVPILDVSDDDATPAAPKAAAAKLDALREQHQKLCQAAAADWARLKRTFTRLDKRTAAIRRLDKRIRQLQAEEE